MRTRTFAPQKKPYQPPKLSVYGDLSHLTQTAPSNKGSMEMATGSPKT